MCGTSEKLLQCTVQYFVIIFYGYLLVYTEASNLSNLLINVKEITGREEQTSSNNLPAGWKFTPLEPSSAQTDETGISANGKDSDDTPDYSAEYEPPNPEPLIQSVEKKPKLTNEELDELHAVAQQSFIDSFKMKMMSKLGWLALPNVTDEDMHRYPAHVIQAMNSQDDGGMQRDDPFPPEQDHYHAKITTSLRFAERLPDYKMVNKRNGGQFPSDTIYFPMPETIDDSNVEKATLFIYPDFRHFANTTVSHISIHSNGRSKNALHEKKLFETSSQHWEHIDLTREVKSWVSSRNRNNYGLTADVNMIDGTTTPIIMPENFNTKERVPFIKLELNDKQPRRRKRRSTSDSFPRDCVIQDRDQRCCRYKFVLDFDELGSSFNFIISPRRFTANYCMGECQPYYLPATANSHLTAGLTRGKTTRCCTATEMAPLNMLIVGPEGQIDSGNFPGMAIARCGCE